MTINAHVTIGSNQPTAWRNDAKSGGKPGASENTARHRRCYGYAKQAEVIGKHPSVSPILLGNERWYCWRCPPRTEYRVWLELHEQGFSVYLPIILTRAPERQLEPIERPMFAGYGFLGLDLATDRYPASNELSSPWRLITHMVDTEAYGAILRPRVVPIGAIEELQARGRPSDGVIDLDEHSDVSELLTLHPGDPIRVVSGLLAGKTGPVLSTGSLLEVEIDGKRVRLPRRVVELDPVKALE